MSFGAASGQAAGRTYRSRKEYYSTGADNKVYRIVVSRQSNMIIERKDLGVSQSPNRVFQQTYGSPLPAPRIAYQSPKLQSPSRAATTPRTAAEEGSLQLPYFYEVQQLQTTRFEILPRNELPETTDAQFLAYYIAVVSEGDPNLPAYEKYERSMSAALNRYGLGLADTIIAEKHLLEERLQANKYARVYTAATPKLENAELGVALKAEEKLVYASGEGREKERPVDLLSKKPRPKPVNIRISFDGSQAVIKCSRSMRLDLVFISRYLVSRQCFKRLCTKFGQLKSRPMVFSGGPSVLPEGVSIQGYSNQQLPEGGDIVPYEIRMLPLMHKQQMNDELLLGLHGFLDCFTFNSQFINSKRILHSDARSCKAAGAQKVFFPLCLDMHWYGVFYNNASATALFFDSFNQSSPRSEEFACVREAIEEVFGQAEIQTRVIKIPTQRNCYDCGYAMFFIAYLFSHDLIRPESQIDCYDNCQIVTLRYYLLSWFAQNSDVLEAGEETSGSDGLEVVAQ